MLSQPTQPCTGHSQPHWLPLWDEIYPLLISLEKIISSALIIIACPFIKLYQEAEKSNFFNYNYKSQLIVLHWTLS